MLDSGDRHPGQACLGRRRGTLQELQLGEGRREVEEIVADRWDGVLHIGVASNPTDEIDREEKNIMRRLRCGRETRGFARPCRDLDEVLFASLTDHQPQFPFGALERERAQEASFQRCVVDVGNGTKHLKRNHCGNVRPWWRSVVNTRAGQRTVFAERDKDGGRATIPTTCW